MLAVMKLNLRPHTICNGSFSGVSKDGKQSPDDITSWTIDGARELNNDNHPGLIFMSQTVAYI